MPPGPTTLADAIRTRAREVLAATPPLAEWAAGRDQAAPAERLVPYLRKAGWPLRTVQGVMIPQREHSGPRAGQRTGAAPQDVTVAPESWLRELARRLGWGPADAARFRVPGPGE